MNWSHNAGNIINNLSKCNAKNNLLILVSMSFSPPIFSVFILAVEQIFYIFIE